METLTVPVSSIAPPSASLRDVNPESQEYQDLVESIKIKGFISTPTVVVEWDEDTGTEYEIIDGNNRLHAAIELGICDIPVIIVDGWDEAETIGAQLMMNANHIEMKPTEYAAALRNILHHKPSFNVDQLASSLGKNADWVSKRLSLNKLTEGAKALVDDGTIVASNAYTLSKVPPDLQDDLVQDAISQSVEDFGLLVKDRLKAHRADAAAGGASKEFTPKPKNRQLQAIEQELALLEEGSDASEVLALLAKEQPETHAEAATLALQYAINMDSTSVEAAQILFEERLAERAAKSKVAKEEAAKKAVEKAEKALADKRAALAAQEAEAAALASA